MRTSGRSAMWPWPPPRPAEAPYAPRAGGRVMRRAPPPRCAFGVGEIPRLGRFHFVLRFSFFFFFENASKPETTSNSSSSMLLWRKRWNSPFSASSSSPMFLSARSIAARRLAFSLARDSAHARKSETKRYSRTSARRVACAVAENIGQALGRPRKSCEPAAPVLVQRQQSLADRAHKPPRTWGGCRRGGAR